MFKGTRQVAFFQKAVLMFWTKTNQNWNLFQNVIKQFLVFKHNIAASESRTKMKKKAPEWTQTVTSLIYSTGTPPTSSCGFVDFITL